MSTHRNEGDRLEKIRTVARDYEQKGYRVVLEPSNEYLPEFLRNVRPDMVVMSEDSNIVVEFKSSGSTAENEQMRTIAQLIQAQPTWDFEVYFVGEDTKQDKGEVVNVETINKDYETLEVLYKLDQNRAFLLLYFAVLEAIIRRYYPRFQSADTRKNVNSSIKDMYAKGVISKNEMETLDRLLDHRNRVAHGMRDRAVSRRTIEKAMEILKMLLDYRESYVA